MKIMITSKITLVSKELDPVLKYQILEKNWTRGLISAVARNFHLGT